jgi:hypothetical protein
MYNCHPEEFGVFPSDEGSQALIQVLPFIEMFNFETFEIPHPKTGILPKGFLWKG